MSLTGAVRAGSHGAPKHEQTLKTHWTFKTTMKGCRPVCVVHLLNTGTQVEATETLPGRGSNVYVFEQLPEPVRTVTAACVRRINETENSSEFL